MMLTSSAARTLIWIALVGASCGSACGPGPSAVGRLIAYRDAIRGSDPAKKTSAIADLRRHGWSRFQDVTAPSAAGVPLWQNWPDKAATLGIGGARARRGRPVVHLAPAEEFTLAAQEPAVRPALDATPPTFEAVNYNPATDRHIQNQHFLDPSAAHRRLAAGDREVKAFPVDSIVVKTFWRIVPPKDPTVLGLWEWSDIKHFPAPAREKDWDKHVCVYQSPPAHSDPACRAVGADQFYSLTVQDPSQFACLNCKRTPDRGDRLILIAMHITTKETPDWLWVTFWWRGLDRTDGDEWYHDNAQRPAGLTGFWKNYSMDTTLSLYNRAKQDFTPDSAMFNPYIEGATESTDSNCMRCHDQARVYNSPQFRHEETLVGEEGTLSTDFLWTLAFKMATPGR